MALQSHPGLAGAVGAPELVSPGSWPRLVGLSPAAGSAAAGAQQEMNHLIALLTAPRLELMRGLGAMSEREFEGMRATASKLGTNLSDAEYRAELGRLLETTRSARARIGARPVTPGAATPGAPATGRGLSIEERRSRFKY